jgi:hypothetical protein
METIITCTYTTVLTKKMEVMEEMEAIDNAQQESA